MGAVQVYAGLTRMHKVVTSAFTVTAALITSLLIDHFGRLRMEQHPLNVWRVAGGFLLVAGVALVAKS